MKLILNSRAMVEQLVGHLFAAILNSCIHINAVDLTLFFCNFLKTWVFTISICIVQIVKLLSWQISEIKIIG